MSQSSDEDRLLIEYVMGLLLVESWLKDFGLHELGIFLMYVINCQFYHFIILPQVSR